MRIVWEHVFYGLVYNKDTKEIKSNCLYAPLGYVKMGKIYWNKKIIKRFQWDVKKNKLKL